MSQDGAYLFDPADFWGDEDVEMMTYQQVGMYKRLMWHQWRNGSIPDNPKKLARILSRAGEPFDSQTIAPLLGELLAPFDKVLDKPGRLRQKRLHAVREEWRGKSKAYSDWGKEGADKRWAEHRKKKEELRKQNDGQAMAPLSSPPNGPSDAKRRERKVTEGKENPELSAREGESSGSSDLDAPVRETPKGDRDGNLREATCDGAGSGRAGAGAEDPAGDNAQRERGDGLAAEDAHLEATQQPDQLQPGGEAPGEADPVPGADVATGLADLADKLLKIAGANVQISAKEGAILERRVNLMRQPELELVWCTRILAGKAGGTERNQLKSLTSPICYLDKGPWDEMAGFEAFKRSWCDGFEEYWQDEPSVARAWWSTRSDRGEAKQAINGGGDPILTGLARHKSSQTWQDGMVPNPEKWLKGHRWNDKGRPAKRAADQRPGGRSRDQRRRLAEELNGIQDGPAPS